METTDSGGSSPDCVGGCGVIFKLTLQSGGTWAESVLHSFRGFPKDGARSYANMIFDGAGNLYGATIFGGVNHPGGIFEFTP